MGSGQINMGLPLDLTMIDLWQRPSTCNRKLQLVQTPICHLSGFALTQKASC